jgi:hypothetical protein
MAMLTAKSARKVRPEVVVVVIVPLGVLVTLILVSPSRLILLGVISS